MSVLMQEIITRDKERLELVAILEAEVDSMTDVVMINEQHVVVFKEADEGKRGFFGSIKDKLRGDREETPQAPTPEDIRKKAEAHLAKQGGKNIQDAAFDIPTLRDQAGPKIGDALSSYYKGNKALFIIAAIDNGIAYLQDPKHIGAKATIAVDKLVNGKPSKETTYGQTYKMINVHASPDNPNAPAVIYTTDDSLKRS